MIGQAIKAMSIGLLLLSNSLVHASVASKKHCDPAPVRGTVAESNLITTLSIEQLDAQLAPLGLKAQFGVKLFRVVYETVTPNKQAKSIQASTLLAVPDNQSPVFPWILIQHYTVLGDREAPSVGFQEGLFEASQGFVSVVPDNLGLGVANDVYPTYLFAKAYAENGLDALRAARAFAKAENLKFGPLFLKGYSEGAYATLALQESLETKHAGEFQVVASAPTAGPYDLSSFRQSFAQPQISSVFLNNLFLSYEAWQKPTLNLDRIYALDLDFLRDLYNGNRVFDEIVPLLPTETTAVFEERFVKDLALPKPKTREARLLIRFLSENSLPQGEWTPKTPIRFFHCADDEVVPASITQKTVARLLAKNPAAPVSSVILPSPDPSNPYRHSSCPLFYGYLSYFASMLQEAPASAQ